MVVSHNGILRTVLRRSATATLGRGLSGAPPPPLRPPGNAEEKANEFG